MAASHYKCLSWAGCGVGALYSTHTVHYPNSKLAQLSEGPAARPAGAGARYMRDLPLHPRALAWREPVPTWSSRSAEEGRGMQTGRQEFLAKGQSTAEGEQTSKQAKPNKRQ